MGSLLDDGAGVHHQNAVGLQNGREPMGDDETGAPRHDAAQRLLHQRLVPRVERRGRLVEQQDRRVGENSAGDGEALALAARKRDAALADGVS